MYNKNMNNLSLTDKEAFLAMYAFLEQRYELTKSDDIGSLLGSMSLLEDGENADSAVKSDWNQAIQKALNSEVNADLIVRK